MYKYISKGKLDGTERCLVMELQENDTKYPELKLIGGQLNDESTVRIIATTDITLERICLKGKALKRVYIECLDGVKFQLIENEGKYLFEIENTIKAIPVEVVLDKNVSMCKRFKISGLATA